MILTTAVGDSLTPSGRRHALLLTGATTEEFVRYLEGRRAVPAIRRLRASFEAVRREELERAARGLSEEDAARLERFSSALVGRLLHRPTVRLRELGAAGMDPEELMELYGLLDEELL